MRPTFSIVATKNFIRILNIFRLDLLASDEPYWCFISYKNDDIRHSIFDPMHLFASLLSYSYYENAKCIQLEFCTYSSIRPIPTIQLKSTTLILNLHKCSDPFAFIMSIPLLVIPRLVYSFVWWIFVALLSCYRITIAVVVNIMCQFLSSISRFLC